MINPKSVKTQLIIFLIFFAFFLSFKDKDALFLLALLICVVATASCDSLINYLKNKKFTISESSLISGLIIGYVLSSDQPWWLLALASLCAITSKHLIRFNHRHFFNPAALGILITVLLFNAATQWKGTYLWYILIPAGLYFTYKIRKLELVIGYGLTALFLFGIQAMMQGVGLLNIFGYLSYFFIFIMLIEPKTTPVTRTGKAIFGVAVAVLIYIFTEKGIKFDAELSSLLTLNLFTPLLNNLAKGG